MTDSINPSVVVSMPSQLFTMPREFKSVFNGMIYIGNIDTDPTIQANQIPVYVSNEDGSFTQMPQPIRTNAGGYPVYNGQPAKFVTTQGCSMKVTDSNGVQLWYFPNLLKYDPDQFRQELASNGGASLIGTSSGNTVQESLDDLESSIDGIEAGLYREFPVRFTELYTRPIVSNVFPQGMNEDETYWYITEDIGGGSPYQSRISRIKKSDGSKETATTTVLSHGQGIGVIGDGTVVVGGSQNGFIATVNFDTDTVSETPCTGLLKDFPFCYNPATKRIYQLQDADGSSGNMTRLAILDITEGFKSDSSIDRQIVKAGYPQGIATDGVYIYVVCGNSWAASTGGSWNDYWTLFRMTVGGVVIDRMVYRRNSMGVLIGATLATQQEPQAVSIMNGQLSFMQFISDETTQYNVIFKEDLSGKWVRAIPKNRYVTYNGLDEIAVNPSSLTTGSSIKTIVSNMVDGSSVTFSISNETALAADTGIQFGVCTVTKVNANRALALTIESSSGLTTVISPKASIVGSFGTTQTPPKMIGGSNKSFVAAYTNGSVLTPTSIAITNMLLINNLVIHCTNDQPTNPVAVYKFFREEIDFYISTSRTIMLTSPLAGTQASISFTSAGVTVNSVSGNFYIRNIFTS